MFLFARVLTWVSLFTGLFLVYVPARILAPSGIPTVAELGPAQVAGVVVATAGAAIALWCIATFATLGQGTPAPFDPPRRLVVRGPYRYVRNPMYIGGTLALCGAAAYYASWPLLAYALAFLAVMHLFVVVHEEPSLRTRFGADYEAYCAAVRRWWPRVRVPGRR